MKTRTGFVSNSSSSSFILNRKDITDWQLAMLHDHINVCDMMSNAGVFEVPDYTLCNSRYDKWTVEEREDGTVHLDTNMDNFDMRWFMIAIGIKEHNIIREDW